MAEQIGWGLLAHDPRLANQYHAYNAGASVDSDSFDDPLPAVLASTSLISAPSHSSSSAPPHETSTAAASLDEDAKGPVGLPPEVIRAFFLQQQQQHQEAQQQGREDGTAEPLIQVADSAKPKAKTKHRAPRKPMPRWARVILTAAGSLLLVGGGVIGGAAMYQHYMTSLDDRDQLAARVTELKKAEEKLLGRCTHLEQERDKLHKKISDLTTSKTAAETTNKTLVTKVTQLEADRDEAMRYNLNWQKKYASLEEQHSDLQGLYDAAVTARAEAELGLEGVRAEKAALGREVDKLAGAMEKLEGKYASLEATAAQLRHVGREAHRL